MSSLFLTFDDGPDRRWTPAVLDALDAVGARATFFVVAPRAVAQPHLVARMQAGGHTVQLHCDEHVRHTQMQDSEIAEDTRRAMERLHTLGVHPNRWRTPWGISTTGTQAVAREHGLQLVHWTADTEDWAAHAVDVMLARVEPRIKDGAIVLAHDGLGPGALRPGCADTVDLVTPLVALARQRGLECLPLGDPSTPAQVAA